MQEMEKAHLADDSYKFPLMVRLKQQGLMWFGLVWFGVVVLQWCYSWFGLGQVCCCNCCCFVVGDVDVVFAHLGKSICYVRFVLWESA